MRAESVRRDARLFPPLRRDAFAAGSTQRSPCSKTFSLEDRIRPDRPPPDVDRRADRRLDALSPKFAAAYAPTGLPGVPPERLLKAQLFLAIYSLRSQRQLCERIDTPRNCCWLREHGPSAAAPAPGRRGGGRSVSVPRAAVRRGRPRRDDRGWAERAAARRPAGHGRRGRGAPPRRRRAVRPDAGLPPRREARRGRAGRLARLLQRYPAPGQGVRLPGTAQSAAAGLVRP